MHIVQFWTGFLSIYRYSPGVVKWDLDMLDMVISLSRVA